MLAAIMRGPGQAPAYCEFDGPVPEGGGIWVEVEAASLSHVTRHRAAGTHYSSRGGYPFVVGMDGVGKDPDGRRVYFVQPEAPYGSMAERAWVDPAHCVPLPDGLDSATAAAIAIPGMSAWAALLERARLKPGGTVLVNGATGTSGSLAVRIAKHLGAKKVIATGRNPEALRALPGLGADVIIPLGQGSEALEAACAREFSVGVDIVLDYLWGASAETLLISAARHGKESVPIRFIQIGSAGGDKIGLPGAVLRSSALELMGSGIGSIPFPKLFRAIAELLAAAPGAGFTVPTRVLPLREIASAWPSGAGSPRIVFAIR